MSIPFVTEFDFEYGHATQVSPLVRRVVARNPGSFTWTGTGVYIIGHGEVAVIDPGPPIEEHFEALKTALKGEKVTHVLVTHSHMDHSPLSHPLAEWAGCQVYAKGPAIPTESDVRMEAGDDLSFKPDVTIQDDWTCKGPGWTIEAIETPGHTSNHMCYALREENCLFSGDHIMGWSTSVVSPPDGNMTDYMNSLEKVRVRNFDVIYPSHGAPISDNPSEFISAYIEHRHKRANMIEQSIAKGHAQVTDIVKDVYQDVDKKLHPAACHSVLSHLMDMHERKVVETVDGPPSILAQYRLKDR